MVSVAGIDLHITIMYNSNTGHNLLNLIISMKSVLM